MVGLYVEDDENGNKQGNVSVDSDDGRSLNLTPNGFGTKKASIDLVENNGSSAELYLHGTYSANIRMGSTHWDNHDLGFFQLFTNKSDGNGWYYAGADISAGTDGTNSWGSMSLSNNGEEKIALNGNTGDINIAGVLTQNPDL